ncbi:MAG TPA: hypothetical protein VIV40_28355 [Kofleriaceae bacterium]
MLRWIVVSMFALVACKDATGKQSDPKPVETKTPVAQGSAAVPQVAQSNADLEAAKKKDAKKGDQEDNDWTPAEFKQGTSRWKDTGVYLDGKPIGFLTFGELPITLKPTWVKDKVSQDKPPGCPECPAWKWSQQRFYKFTDYLKAMGVDIRKIKVIHVYGPRLSQSVVATGKDLQSKLADKFMFRFGMDIAGKALPWVPEGFGNGKTPDKISGVMIYIDRKPPTVTREGVELDGQPVTGVPYYGEPIRGGIRVYLDDKLATIIKRQELDPKQATQSPTGDLSWNFGQFLKSKGVDASKIVEGWVIRDEKRAEKIPFAELEKMQFAASSQAKGGVLLGDKKIRANAIALHTRPIKDAELPVILPEEQW